MLQGEHSAIFLTFIKLPFVIKTLFCLFLSGRFTQVLLYGPRCEKNCLLGFANNTGTDQPAHPRSLISPVVIRFLESMICNIAAGEISIF